MEKVDRKAKYENKRQIKKVSFNLESEKDLLTYIADLDFSNWVKQKIKNELSNR